MGALKVGMAVTVVLLSRGEALKSFRIAEESFAPLVEGGEVWNAQGGIDFSKSTAFEGQVQIEYTGSRRLDYQAANVQAGLGDATKPPADFTWHHLDDYDPVTNRGTMQLVDRTAHQTNAPHLGGVNQWEYFFGTPYGR
jgi:A nuclease of the HNH/ENDO VII superfamily with conserved WHH